MLLMKHSVSSGESRFSNICSTSTVRGSLSTALTSGCGKPEKNNYLIFCFKTNLVISFQSKKWKRDYCKINGVSLTARSQETTELKTLWYFWDASPSPLLSLVPSWIYSNASFDSARLRRRRDTLRLDSARVTAFLPAWLPWQFRSAAQLPILNCQLRATAISALA